ncbi:MAG: hypothetical protein AAB489_05300 [Patescibacteria group bacterium]
MTEKDWSIGAWAKALGHGLAYAQHLGDKVTEWGFEKMKEAGEKSPAKQEKNAYAARAKKAGRSALSLIGELGRAYYDRYEELKRREGR